MVTDVPERGQRSASLSRDHSLLTLGALDSECLPKEPSVRVALDLAQVEPAAVLAVELSERDGRVARSDVVRGDRLPAQLPVLGVQEVQHDGLELGEVLRLLGGHHEGADPDALDADRDLAQVDHRTHHLVVLVEHLREDVLIVADGDGATQAREGVGRVVRHDAIGDGLSGRIDGHEVGGEVDLVGRERPGLDDELAVPVEGEVRGGPSVGVRTHGVHPFLRF